MKQIAFILLALTAMFGTLAFNAKPWDGETKTRRRSSESNFPLDTAIGH